MNIKIIPMKKYTISIAEPCSVPLQDMTPVEGGRYCSNCQRQVVDFTGMTDQQFIAYFEKYGKGCGTFRPSQLNRAMAIKPARRWMPAALLAGVLSVIWPESGKGQYKVTGVLKDANCAPIPGVSISMTTKDGKEGDIKAITSRDGDFSLVLPQSGNYEDVLKFKLSCIGYETREMQVSLSQLKAKGALTYEWNMEESVSGRWDSEIVMVRRNWWQRLKYKLFN